VETIKEMARNMDNHGAHRIACAMNYLARQDGVKWVFYSPYYASYEGQGLKKMTPDDLSSERVPVSFEQALTLIAERFSMNAAFWIVYGRMPLEDVLGTKNSFAPAPA